MSERIVRVAALFALLLATACGFQPLYGERPTVRAEDNLAHIFIGTIPDRAGQMLRNALDQRLDPNNLELPALYNLQVGLKESVSYLAQRKDASATRANLTLAATYTLVAKSSGETVYSGTVRSVNSYDILSTENEFGTLTARDEARRRAARDLSDQIAVRLALALEQVPPAGR